MASKRSPQLQYSVKYWLSYIAFKSDTPYGRLGYTSERRDIIARMARIKEMKDVGSLRGRESFHDNDGVVQVVVVDCLASLIVT